MEFIQPRTLKGFRDFLPSDMRIRQYVFSVFRETFEKYGYEPLETPVLEYADILMGKYGEEAEQLMYHFKDRGEREVAMKYDLTVPTCRVLAQYQNDLPLPFKRYQIQPVWRAENTQKGRFREFYQCDADTFGSSSQMVEAEYIQMGVEVLQKLGFKDVLVRINNRKIIDGITKYAGASDSEFYTICIAVDKLDKIGMDAVKEEMARKGVAQDTIEKVVVVVSIPAGREESLAAMKEKLKDVAIAVEGLEELQNMFAFLKVANVPEQFYQFDPTIIRGLSYYTGPVWEFVIVDGGVGSVGGCGRYDNLVKLYSGKDIPAAGGSFGIERLIEIIKDRNMIQIDNNEEILVTVFSPELAGTSIRVAKKLRAEGKKVMIYPDQNTKLDKQLKYSNKKNIPLVVIVGDQEKDQGIFKIKNMQTGEETTSQL
jgi:histidyl-tRNA synthetase